MKANNLPLERSGFDRPERIHDGKVIMVRSNLRWCSDELEFICWNGDVAETVLNLIGDWIEDYNENHPDSGLRRRSPREFIKAKTETA